MSPVSREKQKEYSKKRYNKNKEAILAEASQKYSENSAAKLFRQRGNQLRKYWPGLTGKQAQAEYDKLLDKQNNVCGICNEAETKIDHQRLTVCRLAVDHSYVTGKVRGLLCFRCNTTLGRFERFMSRILIYLAVGPRVWKGI